MSVAQQFCLRWNNHQPNFVSVFSSLLSSQALTDVTLAAEGQHLEAHRVVLSACSTYFQSLFTTNKSHLHPIVILKDVQFCDLRTMVDFMYSGEVHVSQEQLPSILKTAETLKIKGLAEVQGLAHLGKSQEKQMSSDSRLSCEVMGMSVESGPWERRSPSPSSSASAAQRRKRMRKSSTGSTSESTVTERTSEEVTPEVGFIQSPARLEQQSSSQLTMSADLSERSGSLREQTSTDSDLQNCSQDSGEQAPIPMQQQGAAHGEVSPEVHNQQQAQQMPALPARSVDEPAVSSPQVEASPHPYPTSLAPTPGESSPKARRNRLLIRQPRIKKERDPLSTSPDSDPDLPQQVYLQVPPVRMERQSSEPLPSTSASTSKSLLQVPTTGSYLQKQHSHPLLPSQQTKPSPGFIVKSSQLLIRQSTIQEDFSSDAMNVTKSDHLPVLRVIPDTEMFPAGSVRSREPIKRAASTPQTSSLSSEAERLGHCPCLRPGPALGCNYCWNTIDKNGRILRRKTKYYCPECQTNLCIVPCFQEYHEKYDKDAKVDKSMKTAATSQQQSASSSEPATSCVLVSPAKSFAKTTSM